LSAASIAQFTIIPNAIFRDDRLSIEAKGVLGYLLSHPQHWQFRLDHIGRSKHREDHGGAARTERK
jgi:hypothetical protein